MGNTMITYVKDNRVVFMAGEQAKPTVEFLKKAYEESGGPSIIGDIRSDLDAHPEVKGILENEGLIWPDNNDEIVGSGGFFDSLSEEGALQIAKYIGKSE